MDEMTLRFDPSRYITKVGNADYLPVKWRLVWLRTVHPDAAIETQAVTIEDAFAVFRATVSVPGGGKATGYGSETPKDFRDFIEKAETKAIGRALAALGFGTQFCEDFDEAHRIVDAPVDPPPPRENRQTPRTNPPQTANMPVNNPTPIASGLPAVHAAAKGKVEGEPHARASALAQAVYGVPSMRDLTPPQCDALRKAFGECRGPEDGEALIALAIRINAASASDEMARIGEDVRAAELGPDRRVLLSAAFVRVRKAVEQIEAMPGMPQPTGTAGADRWTT